MQISKSRETPHEAKPPVHLLERLRRLDPELPYRANTLTRKLTLLHAIGAYISGSLVI